MKTPSQWHGVRMRRTLVGADADAPLRSVTLPASWDDMAAAGLAALVAGSGPVRLAFAADAFIRPLAARAAAVGLALPLADRLHALLLARRGTPDAGLWRRAPEPVPGFVLNLAAFHEPGSGFATAAFAEAVETAVLALALARPEATRIAVRIADLAGLLAALGLDYESPEAREVAAGIAALLRGRAETASARLGERYGTEARPARGFTAPQKTVVPGLAEAAARALAEAAAAPRLRHEATTAIAPAGPAEALLGVETGGIAPAFSPIRPDGSLTRAARAWLAARGISAEAALASALAGSPLLVPASKVAHLAMHERVAGFFHSVPPLPAIAAEPSPMPRARDSLPTHTRGYTQKTSVGGHRLYVQTSEYADGRLGELAITLHKEAPSFRGLMDAFAAAVSIGLQHGVPLADYVEAFVGTRFGPAGAVEGDPAVPTASSLIDYVFRNLAAHYLKDHDLPEVEAGDALEAIRETPPAPLLPLELPAATPGDRRRVLRLIKK
ncbi:MAG TPA: TSCPD domain-containing protein [Acetobacteraceae bacterium]|nr:TSCPD domain-containing protein [Acetobacteraceae bacterium]